MQLRHSASDPNDNQKVVFARIFLPQLDNVYLQHKGAYRALCQVFG